MQNILYYTSLSVTMMYARLLREWDSAQKYSTNVAEDIGQRLQYGLFFLVECREIKHLSEIDHIESAFEEIDQCDRVIDHFKEVLGFKTQLKDMVNGCKIRFDKPKCKDSVVKNSADYRREIMKDVSKILGLDKL